MDNKDGGSAFPTPIVDSRVHGVVTGPACGGDTGMTMRAYIATKAMASMLVSYKMELEAGASASDLAQDSVRYADALISELNK